jgi:hypothetical protein
VVPRYYAECEATPALSTSKHNYQRGYENAPSGFLFHDTETELGIDHLRKPVWKLAELFEGAHAAYLVRVSSQTIFVAFSFGAFPRPTEIKRGWGSTQTVTDLLSDRKMKGWVIEDVGDATKLPQFIDYNNLYDNCVYLDRLSGMCPCPRLETGECAAEVIAPNLPEKITANTLRNTDFSKPDTQLFKRKRYVNLDGFEFASGKATTHDSFATTLRPWEDYDFSVVIDRKEALSKQGKKRGGDRAQEKEQCTFCAFKSSMYNGSVKGCTQLSRCRNPAVNISDVWGVLRQLYYAKGLY